MHPEFEEVRIPMLQPYDPTIPYICTGQWSYNHRSVNPTFAIPFEWLPEMPPFGCSVQAEPDSDVLLAEVRRGKPGTIPVLAEYGWGERELAFLEGLPDVIGRHVADPLNVYGVHIDNVHGFSCRPSDRYDRVSGMGRTHLAVAGDIAQWFGQSFEVCMDIAPMPVRVYTFMRTD
jgi:hypothetical protein